MKLQELQKIGFVSQEHYDATLRTLQSDRTGEYADGGATGAKLTSDAVRKMRSYFMSYRTDGEMWTTHGSVGKYPAQTDLSGQMPPVFDQGSRGSCVGQAVTGLANYYFGKQTVLSAEYTYGVLKKYEYEEYSKAYEMFISDPNQYQSKWLENKQQLRDFENNDDDLRTSNWYLKYRFPAIVNLELHRREDAAAKIMKNPPKIALPVSDLRQLLMVDNPILEDGSWLSIAYRVFQKEGFCAHDILPYSYQEIPDNRGHLPMPADAVQDASARRITDELHLFSSAGNIDEFKKFLTGNNGKWEPMPVALSVACFKSWCNNPFTRKTGWFSMPIPAENKIDEYLEKVYEPMLRENYPEATEEQIAEAIRLERDQLHSLTSEELMAFLEDILSGHAMLAVGYVDEPLVAGGGYLLVRNSWAENWAWDSDHPGHAKIPYAYIEHFCTEALSIIKPKRRGSVTPVKQSVPAEDDLAAGKLPQELSPAEIQIIALTDDPETAREVNHLTHRLAMEGYLINLEANRLPAGKLRERLAVRPDNIRDVILLSGPGKPEQSAMLGKEIVHLADSGKNIISVQLGDSNAELLKALPENCRKLVSYNRIKIHENSFNEDFSEIKMRLKSLPQQNIQQSRALFEAFRKALKSASSEVNDGTDEDIPDLYEVLRKNMSFRFLEALVLYLLRKGFHVLDSKGEEIHSARQVAMAMSANGHGTFTLVPVSGSGRFYLKYDKKQGRGIILQDTDDKNERHNAESWGLYRFLKWLFTPVTIGMAAQNEQLEVSGVPIPRAPAESAAVRPQNTAAVQDVQDKNVSQTPMSKPESEEEGMAIRRKNDFRDAVDRNICRLDLDYCFPDLDLPSRYKLLPWKLRVKEVIKRDCEIGDLISRLEERCLITAEDRDRVKKTSSLMLYELKNGGISVLFISVYLTLWKNGRKMPIDDSCLNVLTDLKESLKRSMKDLYCPRLSGTGLMLGTADAAIGTGAEAYRRSAASFQGGKGEFVIYCDYNTSLEKWTFVFPAGWDGYYWWHFVEHLLPVDPAVCLRELIASGNNGCSTTEERLEKNLGLPHALFASAFERLKPSLVILPDKAKTQDGEEAVQYGLDPRKSQELPRSVSGFRRVARGVRDYYHSVICCGAFVIGGIVAGMIHETSLTVRVLILALASLIGKTIVEWDERRIKRQ